MVTIYFLMKKHKPGVEYGGHVVMQIGTFDTISMRSAQCQQNDAQLWLCIHGYIFLSLETDFNTEYPRLKVVQQW